MVKVWIAFVNIGFIFMLISAYLHANNQKNHPRFRDTLNRVVLVQMTFKKHVKSTQQFHDTEIPLPDDFFWSRKYFLRSWSMQLQSRWSVVFLVIMAKSSSKRQKIRYHHKIFAFHCTLFLAIATTLVALDDAASGSSNELYVFWKHTKYYQQLSDILN